MPEKMASPPSGEKIKKPAANANDWAKKNN